MVDHQEIKKKDGTEVFLLIEYCPNGTLFDLIESKCQIGLNGITDEQELYKVLNDVSNGLRLMHSKQIAHRDIKIENVLKGSDQFWKICDFGSCSSIQHNSQISANEKDLIKEEIEKMTTPIYRAPEQIDLYKGYKINT